VVRRRAVMRIIWVPSNGWLLWMVGLDAASAAPTCTCTDPTQCFGTVRDDDADEK
jgi:hypothetical protein